MPKLFLKTGFLLILLITGLNSCISLKSVNDFSSKSSDGIKKFEDLNYSFTQHCIDKCQFESIRKFEIKRKSECYCDGYIQADSVTLLIYNSIKGYFNGLLNLSNNKLTDYCFDALKNAIKEGTFGDIKIEESHVDAYSKISKILLKTTTDLYRKNKINQYIDSANAPIQILLTKLQFILQKNLEDELNFKKEKLYVYYQDIKNLNTLSDYEKGKSIIDYYQQLSDINNKQKQIEVFVKGLKTIAAGHQTLYNNRNMLTSKKLKELLIISASNVQDIISEFNKLKD